MLFFDNIDGQEDVKKRLTNDIKTNRINHAYAFTGSVEIEKKTMAYAFAAALLCEKALFGETCGKCLSCTSFSAESNPDFLEVATDSEAKTSSSIKVESIREMREELFKKPICSKRKVCVISDAEKMTIQAQNSLLKILEEPPQYAVIILTVSNYDALLPTIQSRVVKIIFRRLPDFNLGLSNDERVVEIREFILKCLLAQKKDIELWSELKSYIAKEPDIPGKVLDILLTIYRDILMVSLGLSKRLINFDKKDTILECAAKYSLYAILSSIEDIEKMRNALKHNVNAQFVMDVLQIKLLERVDIVD